MKRMKVTLSLVFVLWFSGVAKATPIFSDQEKDAQMLQEAALTGYWLLGDLFGDSLGNSLNITSGTFSGTAWAFSLTGMYDGMSTDIGFSGSYDAASESGTFATHPVT